MKRVDAERCVQAALSHDILDPLRPVRGDDGDLGTAFFADKVEEAPERLLVPTDRPQTRRPES
jgi:hypothetical protein